MEANGQGTPAKAFKRLKWTYQISIPIAESGCYHFWRLAVKTLMPRELWRLTGAYWALPIGVDFPDDQTDVAIVRIGHGLCLLNIQRETALARLTDVGASRVASRLTILRSQLETVASPATETDPEKVVEWNPSEPLRYRAPKGNPDEARNRDEFFHDFAKIGWVPNPVQAEVLWQAFCRHALHWLINKGKPVDLGFCELHAIPMRPNWKEIVWAYHYNSGVKVPTIEELTTWLTHEELTMFARALPDKSGRVQTKNHILWSIDVALKRPWWRESMRYERAKRNRRHYRFKGELFRYLGGTKELLVRMLPVTRKLYEAYLSIIRRPFVVLNTKWAKGRVLSRKRCERRGYVTKPRHERVVPVTHDFGSESGSPVEPEAHGSLGAVRAVPPLQHDTGDVRDSRADVEQSEERPS